MKHGLALALLALVLPMAAQAADARIEGVWKIAKPQVQLTPANGGPIPFTAQGRQSYEANKRAATKGDLSFDTASTYCSSPGQPRLMLTAEPFAILQQPRMVTILYQWNRLFRQITTGTPLKNPLLGDNFEQFPTMQGHSTGHWEGSTLVVKTVGLSDQKLLDNLIPNSDELELNERIRLRDADTLEDRITVTDPEMFTKPWEAVLTYKRQPDAALPFPEDVCLNRRAAGKAPLPR
jgi:hypothetical protein